MLWGLGPVRAKATYDIAVDRLRRQIHSGLLLPAEKLPAERQLSDDFGISRVTLREALRVLETDRYIVVRRGSQGGTFVNEADCLVEISTRRITRAPANAMRVLEFLCANEMAASGLAAERASPLELKRMRHAIGMMQSALSMPHLKQAETYFHLGLGAATQNVLMAQAIEDGLSELFLPFGVVSLDAARDGAMHLHRDLLTAIEAGKTDAAKETMAAIHDSYWRRVRQLTRSAA